MELTKEAVNRCRSVGALRDFLCQAMDQIDEKDKEIARQKRKRCLAMAMWCWGVKELNRYGDQDYMDFAEKWRKRWLSIAEKFKEAK